MSDITPRNQGHRFLVIILLNVISLVVDRLLQSSRHFPCQCPQILMLDVLHEAIVTQDPELLVQDIDNENSSEEKR